MKENFCCKTCEIFKATLLGLRQFLTSKNPLKVMENAFFTSKALFVLNIFSFLPWPFGHVAKRLDKKDKSVAVSLTNNWSKRNHGIKFCQLIILSTSLNQYYIVCFYCMSSWGLSKHIKIKRQTVYFYIILSFFRKQKVVVLELVFQPLYLKKYISLIIFY